MVQDVCISWQYFLPGVEAEMIIFTLLKLIQCSTPFLRLDLAAQATSGHGQAGQHLCIHAVLMQDSSCVCVYLSVLGEVRSLPAALLTAIMLSYKGEPQTHVGCSPLFSPNSFVHLAFVKGNLLAVADTLLH